MCRIARLSTQNVGSDLVDIVAPLKKTQEGVPGGVVIWRPQGVPRRPDVQNCKTVDTECRERLSRHNGPLKKTPEGGPGGLMIWRPQGGPRRQNVQNC